MQEMSIEKGETIWEDWETWTEREDRIREECGRVGETFYPESDWYIAERQAEDYARALDNSEKERECITRNQLPNTTQERQAELTGAKIANLNGIKRVKKKDAGEEKENPTRPGKKK